MEVDLAVAIRTWQRQKGAQHQDTSGRGCAWCAGQSLYTKGTAADCKQAEALIDGIEAKALLADRGYDLYAIVEKAEKAGMKAVVPPRKNRKIQREYDKELYKLRHWVENAFLTLKRWRGIATRYAKNTASFLAAVQIRCIAAWIWSY